MNVPAGKLTSILLRRFISINLKSDFKRWKSLSRSRYVGFIGLGNMGSKMVENLLKKGEKVILHDTNEAVTKLFVNQQNVKVANSVKEVAKGSDVVISMLPNSCSVLNVYTGDEGIIRNSKRDAVCIDCSTVEPSVSQQVHAVANKADILFFDAPVSGGVQGAKSGTLTFMVGGREQDLEKIEDILLKMGSRIVYCGSSGSGQAAKLCNNMLLGVTMVGISEALNLGSKFGLDPKLLLSVINTSSGRCWVSECYPPVPWVNDESPSSNDYKGGFNMQLLIKDMTLAKNMASEVQAETQVSDKALAVYENAAKEGFIEYDFSVIYKYLTKG